MVLLSIYNNNSYSAYEDTEALGDTGLSD